MIGLRKVVVLVVTLWLANEYVSRLSFEVERLSVEFSRMLGM